VRLVFDTPTGPGLNASLMDVGNRFRLLINEVDVVGPDKPLPKAAGGAHRLGLQTRCYQPRRRVDYAGGAHHTCFSQAVTTEMLEDFGDIARRRNPHY